MKLAELSDGSTSDLCSAARALWRCLGWNSSLFSDHIISDHATKTFIGLDIRVLVAAKETEAFMNRRRSGGRVYLGGPFNKALFLLI
jgi:hypothetical protein